LRTGSIRRLDVPPPLLGFRARRWRGRLLCVFNLGEEAVQWPVPAGWRVIEQIGDGLEPMAGWIAERSQ
jgi:alpha-glucosidase